MRVGPSVCSASPVETKQDQSGAADEKSTAYRVTGPDVILERPDGAGQSEHYRLGARTGGLHLGVLDVLGRPVKGKQADTGEAMEDSLGPEDPAPAAGVGVGHATSTQCTDPVPRVQVRDA